MTAFICSVEDILKEPLHIPTYQRPYRWSVKSVVTLLTDISKALNADRHDKEFRYRIGTIILHREKDRVDVVDGQQRLITLLLIRLFLEPEYSLSPLAEGCSLRGNESLTTARRNYSVIANWFAEYGDSYRMTFAEAFSSLLECVVIEAPTLSEAFQLFDSQNSRGKELDPHDLLKAYHLRAMRNKPIGEMNTLVKAWETSNTSELRDLFAIYLYPIGLWSLGEKCSPFTARQIDAFKGISPQTGYAYALRAQKTVPFFQIGKTFTEGADFFGMVAHYQNLTECIKSKMKELSSFDIMARWLDEKQPCSHGLQHARQLFYCVLLKYYDRFSNYDEQAIRKLFIWAFSLRVDLLHLGFDSVNKYAVENDDPKNPSRYTNRIPMFKLIEQARLHSEISNCIMRLPSEPKSGRSPERYDLWKTLQTLQKR